MEISCMTEFLPMSPGRVVQQAADFKWDGGSLETGIALALSGGGFRAMLFHAGALMRLNELGILSRVARISSVSGGSIAAGYLACVWNQLGPPDVTGAFEQFQPKYVEPVLSFSREKIDVEDVLTGVLPWTSAAEQVAASYDKLLFHDLTLQNAPDQPRFIFCSTNMQTGVLWRFSKPYAGDYIVGRLDKPNLPLSKVVAASSAFPPFLSPLVLTLPQGSFTDWPGQPAAGGGVIDPAPFRARVLLTDGGVYDNLGLEPIVKRYMTVLVSDGGSPFGRNANIATDWVRQLQRVVDVIDNQVRALRVRDLIARFQAATNLQPDQVDPTARFGTYWGIDTDPTKVSPINALPCAGVAVNQLAHLGTRLSDLGETQSLQLVNWGYAICDRCIRVHYNVPEIQEKTTPRWPYPQAPLS
jgi:NTE family protein